jgi:hypothetical protein
LIEILTKDYQFGLIPWASSWYHQYSLPAKTATYTHSGLPFILGSDYKSLIEFLPDWACFTFDGSSGLRKVMKQILSLSNQEILDIRLRLKQWGLDNAILDSYGDRVESNIKKAYAES